MYAIRCTDSLAQESIGRSDWTRNIEEIDIGRNNSGHETDWTKEQWVEGRLNTTILETSPIVYNNIGHKSDWTRQYWAQDQLGTTILGTSRLDATI